MITTLTQSSRSRLLPLAGLALLAACGDGNGSTASDGGATALSVSFAPAAGVTTTAAGKSVLVGLSKDTLEITSVQVVLDNVKLRRAGISACPDSMKTADASRRRSSDDRGCSRMDGGPTLLDLPLNGTEKSPLGVTVPAGTYKAFEFEIENVSTSSTASEAEKAFLAKYPELRNVSVKVVGSYKGTAFTFLSRAKAEVEFEFEPALDVKAGVNDNVSVTLDLASWFKDATGAILAPTVANQLRIDQNIMQSFSAFGDSDRDGREDSGRGRGRGRGRSSGSDD